MALHTARPVYIVDGARTPFLKAAGRPGPFAAADLAVKAGRSLLARHSFDPEQIDELILGCVGPSADEANIGRIVSLRLGLGESTPGWTVQRNCASGMQALDTAATNIAFGRSELVMAGGTESMSHAPILYNNNMVNWLADLNRARSLPERLKVFSKMRPGHLKPVIALLRGLTDPIVGMSMGQTAEKIAHRFGIDRSAMDSFSIRSHERLAAAIDAGRLQEIVPIFDAKGKTYEQDEGLRRDSGMEKLAKLRPVFDRPVGNVTAGNSAQVTDGAAMVILASEDAVKTHGLPVLGRMVDSEWAGLDPTQMGLGPVHATAPLLQRNNIKFDDVQYWEINEAFAAQVLGCVAAWADADYCRDELGLAGPMGELDQDRLNVDGGSVAIGHPVGASGARIILHLLHTLHERKASRGVATICIGGGQGGAVLLEAA